MSTQTIQKTEDARELASRIIEEYAGSVFPKMDVGKLAGGEQNFSVSRTRPDGGCEEIDSCSGPDWKDCAVSALANALWQSRECWNRNVVPAS